MPRYKPIDRSPRLLPFVLAEQIQLGIFLSALNDCLGNAMAGALATRLWAAEERSAAGLGRTRPRLRVFEAKPSLRNRPAA